MKAFYMIILIGLFTELSFSQTTFHKEIFSTTEKLRIGGIDKIGDGSFIFIANGENPHALTNTDGHYFISKIDSAGNLLWSKSFINYIYWFSSHDVQKFNDSSFVILTLGFLMKFKNDGQLEFKKVYKDSVFATLDNVYLTNDNGMLFSGRTNPNQVVLIKTDSIGQVLWSRDYNIGFRSTPFKVFNGGNGNFLITGTYQDSMGSISKFFMILVDNNGQILNAREYHRPGTQQIYNLVYDSTLSVIYFTTYDDITHQNLIGKINTVSGQVIWTKFISSLTNGLIFQNDTIYALEQDANNYFIQKFDTAGIPYNSVAWSESLLMVRIILRDNKFIVLSSDYPEIQYCQFNMDSMPLCEQPPTSITVNSTSGYVFNPINVGSNSRNFLDSTESVTIVNNNYVSYNSCIPQNLSSIENKEEQFEIYPQPAQDFVSIKYMGTMQNDFSIMIFDIFGKLIDSRSIDFYDADTFTLSTQEISRGNYIFCLRDKNEVIFRRPLILE